MGFFSEGAVCIKLITGNILTTADWAQCSFPVSFLPVNFSETSCRIVDMYIATIECISVRINCNTAATMLVIQVLLILEIVSVVHTHNISTYTHLSLKHTPNTTNTHNTHYFELRINQSLSKTGNSHIHNQWVSVWLFFSTQCAPWEMKTSSETRFSKERQTEEQIHIKLPLKISVTDSFFHLL